MRSVCLCALRVPACRPSQVQPAVDVVAGHQLAVGAHLHHLAVRHHVDALAGGDGRHAVRDDETRTAALRRVQGLLHQLPENRGKRDDSETKGCSIEQRVAGLNWTVAKLTCSPLQETAWQMSHIIRNNSASDRNRPLYVTHHRCLLYQHSQ